MRAWVGILWRSEKYTQEVEHLKKMRERLPNRYRPDFPLRRRVLLSASEGPQITELTPDCEQFCYRVFEFLNKWNLQELATWDLPIPQGPLLHNPFGANRNLMPSSGVRPYLPSYYPVIKTDELATKLNDLNRAETDESDISDEVNKMDQYLHQASLAEISFIERVIRQRVQGPDPKGLRMHLDHALEVALGYSLDTIRKYRTKNA